MIERDLSDPDGIIVARLSGRWSRAEIETHYQKLRTIVAQKRAESQPIRVLSDLSTASEIDQDVDDHVLELCHHTYLPGDRVAILTSDNVSKHRLRARLQGSNVAVFSSRLPAEMWLMAEDLPPPGSGTVAP